MIITSYVYARSMPPVHEPKKTPGERMREYRENLKLSFRQAGERAGVSPGTIQRMEEEGLAGRSFEVIMKVARAYGISATNMHRIANDLEPIPEAALAELGKYQVHPDWVAIPVYGVVSAGSADAEPLEHEPAMIPREHLARRGASPETTQAYIVNGRCMISPEASRLDRGYAPGDYVAVDTAKGYEPGDVVIAWWPEGDKLVIKRYKYEADDVVLSPIAPGHASLVLPSEDDLHIIGPVIWRGG